MTAAADAERESSMSSSFLSGSIEYGAVVSLLEHVDHAAILTHLQPAQRRGILEHGRGTEAGQHVFYHALVSEGFPATRAGGDLVFVQHYRSRRIRCQREPRRERDGVFGACLLA